MSPARHLFLAGVALILARPAVPQPVSPSPEPYPRMAPLEQYLTSDRAEEIALARSAAPPSVSRDAGILVLGRTGNEKAEESKNGFVCVVMRGWSGPGEVGKPYADFWNPKVRAPICFSPDAVRTALPVYLRRTELALEGKSKDELLAQVHREIGDGSLPVPSRMAMAYMMSRRQFLGERVTHFKPHLMLYVPYARTSDWSGTERVAHAFVGADEGSPQALVIVPLPQWSDGTPAGGHP